MERDVELKYSCIAEATDFSAPIGDLSNVGAYSK